MTIRRCSLSRVMHYSVAMALLLESETQVEYGAAELKIVRL